MKTTLRIEVILILVVIVYNYCLAGAPAWSDLRKMEPVIFPGEQVPDFIGSNVNQIWAYQYLKKSNSWRQIPFQIDEKGLEISTNFNDSTQIDTFYNYFGELNGVLDPAEEILFMAPDIGDKAPENQWIPDLSSRDFPRYEIQIRDPLDPSQIGYVYLYQSRQLQPDPDLADYVELTPATTDTTGDDIITGVGYSEGHDSNGFTTDWKILAAQSGNETDLLDLLKMRLKVNFGIIIKLMESDALKIRRIDYVDGRIRIVRRLNYFLEFSLFVEPIGVADFTTYYYPYHTDVKGPTKRLNPDWGISYLRQSFDLNENAVGMYFYNPFNTRILIDGNPDDNVDRTLFAPPRVNWHLITGEPGSILFTYALPPLGTKQELYYFDNINEPSADGFTRDTGDEKSYGDIGMAISGEKLEGSFGMSYQALFLAPHQVASVGQAYIQTLENPITVQTNALVFDRIPPNAITDLQVTDFTLKSITLSWTAPGDDGAAGKAVTRYEMRYSKLPVVDELDEWWQFAKVAKVMLSPAEPGTIQKVTVSGLEAEQTYYFVIKSQDDMGYWSDFSNVATGTAYPVELVAFTVLPQHNQVVLEWKTASETNNHGFDIEKRAVGTRYENQWEVIGFVNGRGTTAIPQNYRFIDKNIAVGTFEYRLKQIDCSGSFTYSAIQRVTIEAPKTFALWQNYPNPFNSATLIEFEIPARSPVGRPRAVVLKIFNTLGDEVQRYELNDLAAGTHRQLWSGIDTQGRKVAAGIYFYQLQAEEVVLTRKMMLLP